jgi:hypothetical protein
MPSVTVEIPETYSAITRPVIVEVARDLIKKIGLPTDTSLTFLGSSETGIQPGSTLTKPEENNTFSQSSNIRLEASEVYIEDRVLTTAVARPENKAFFRDNALRINIAPVYVGTEVTLSLRLRAKDRTSAEKWKDELRLRTSQGRGELLHTLNYHYEIPRQFLIILSEIHTLREQVAGYDEDIYTWFKKCLTNKTTKLTTQAGTEPVLAVGEEQIGVLGWFEFVSNPENPQKANEGGAYEIGFDYKFVYDKVVATNFKYPLVIHNQFLDSKFRPEYPIYQLNLHHMEPSWSKRHVNKFTGLFNDKKSTGLSGVTIPEFDDWVPKYVQPNTSTIYSTVLGVDLDNPNYLLNIVDIGHYLFDPAIIRFLKGESPYLNLTNQSIFHVSMFNWEYPLPEKTISVNNNLEAYSDFDLNPRNHYHFRLAVVNDLTILSKDAIERLRNDPEAAFEIIKILHPDFSNTCSTAFYTRIGLAPETTLEMIFNDLPEIVDPKITLKDLFCSNLLNDAFLNNYDLYLELKKLINELLIGVGLLPKPVGGKLIKIKDITEIINAISKNVVKNLGQIEHRLRTVGQYVIVARKEE